MAFDLLSFWYEDRAAAAIESAKTKWNRVEQIVLAIEWGIIRDHEVGQLVNERGIRAFVYPGAKSVNEPDVEVVYEITLMGAVVHDLTFREPVASRYGHAE